MEIDIRSLKESSDFLNDLYLILRPAQECPHVLHREDAGLPRKPREVEYVLDLVDDVTELTTARVELEERNAALSRRSARTLCARSGIA